jgi:hypothetical protein
MAEVLRRAMVLPERDILIEPLEHHERAFWRREAEPVRALGSSVAERR